MSRLLRPGPSASLLRAAAILLLAAAPCVLGVRAASAEGGPMAQPPAPSPAEALGLKYFDDAIRYVARGQAGIPEVHDFFVNLDAKLELDEVRHEGPMRLWFQAPNNYRQELSFNNATSTKILSNDPRMPSADRGWIITPSGRVQDLMLSAEGRSSITQLKNDRDRLADLTKFLTLQALKGGGARFVFEGFKKGSGTYAGDWVKVTRQAPGRSNIMFWLAYVRDPQTGAVVATWPGIVRVEGDVSKGYPTEDYILREWDFPGTEARTFRYPHRIEAYSILTDPQGRTVPTRFLYAIVQDIKINAGIDPARFQPR
jgi:hypothetical protein